MPQRINIDVVKAFATTPEVARAAISFPSGTDLTIYPNGVSATTVTRLAVARTPGGDPLWTTRGVGGFINVYAPDIRAVLQSGVQYYYSISIEDPGSFGITNKSSTFLAEGTFLISNAVAPEVTKFDEQYIEGATLPILKLKQAEYDSLAQPEAGRPYLIYDLTITPPYMQDGAFPIVAVYIGEDLQYFRDPENPTGPVDPDPEGPAPSSGAAAQW